MVGEDQNPGGLELLLPLAADIVKNEVQRAAALSDRVIVFSHRPGTIRCEFNIPLPRPRNMDIKSDPEFLHLENQIWKLIEQEVKAAGGFAQL